MVQAMSLCIFHATCAGILLYLDAGTIINQVFNNVGKLINGKRIIKTFPSDYFLSTIMNFVFFLNKVIRLETVRERLIPLSILILSSCISLLLLYEKIYRKVKKELEYDYDNKTSFSIFMTLFFAVLLCQWSNKIPSREELEADKQVKTNKRVKNWIDKVDGDWVDDYDPFRGEWIDDAKETNFKKSTFKKPTKKPTKKIIDDVINLKYGCLAERRRNLESMGYDYDEVQHEVNLEIRRRAAEEEDIKRIYRSLLKDKIEGKVKFDEKELMNDAKIIYNLLTNKDKL